MKKFNLLILIILVTFSIYISIAYSISIMTTEIGQLGASDKTIVNKYNIRVISISLTVSGNIFNNLITGVSITVASSIQGTYNIYVTVSSSTCSASATWNNVGLGPTTIQTLSSSLSPQCSYTTNGVTVEVRGVPA